MLLSRKFAEMRSTKALRDSAAVPKSKPTLATLQGLLMYIIHTCTHLNVLFVNCLRFFESRKDTFFLENFETKINRVFQSTGPISMA